MSNRNKILLIFGIGYVVFALVMYFGLKINLKNKFSEDGLKKTISGESVFKDTTTDLCRYQILGDPKEAGNYVKIEILCKNNQKANSTLSLSAIEDKTISGFLNEYARIIGFDVNYFSNNKFSCYVDNVLITDEIKNNSIRPTATIKCSEN